MNWHRGQLALYLVMGTNNCFKPTEVVLEEAIKGGITMFQFREKGAGSLSGNSKIQLAKKFQKICYDYEIPFIVNDDVELAIKLNADGVHIGQEDGSITKVRKQIGKKILGVSTHNVEEARNAVDIGADYIGVGPMFYTDTKSDIEEVRGPVVIEEIRSANISIPLVGIGGINHSNARSVLVSGADGIAVISSITRSSNPEQSAFSLRFSM